MHPQYNALVGTAFLNILIATYVLSTNRHGIVQQAFFLFVGGTALWISSIALLFSTQNFVFNQWVFYGGALMFWGLTYFARVFPHGKKPSRRFYWLAMPAVSIVPLAAFDLFVTDMIAHADGTLEPVIGPAMPIFTGIIIGYFAVSLRFFIRNARQANDSRARTQFGYLLVGIVVLVVSTILFDAVLPALGINTLNTFGPLASVVFVSLTAYAIVRHQLMDIRVVIQRGVIYSTLLVLIIGFYLGTVLAIGYFFHQITNSTVLLAAGLTMIVGISTVPTIERRFRKATDRIFFKDRYDYSAALRELSEVLHRGIELDQIVQQLADKLERILRSSGVRIQLDTTLTDTISDGRTITAPIILDGQTIGTITAEPKRSGDSYTPEDAALLSTVSLQAAVALERAKLYEQVKVHSRELEQKVRERTARIHELHDSQKQIVADIAHGLQTPLTIVKSQIDYLRQQLSDHEQLDALERSIDQVATFIYDMLKLTRLEQTRDLPTTTIVDLSMLLREIVEYFTVLANDQGITIRATIADGIRVRAQREQLHDMAVNLLSNAVKYMDKDGKREITITLETRSTQAILTVTDTGIGIPANDLPHIFERFYRVQKREEAARGFGMGLAITKTIIDKLGGTIEARSTLGHGTTMIVQLPVA